MTFYTPQQLAILLALLGLAGLGLGVDHWRRAHPDLVERLEALDRVPVEGPTPTVNPASSSPGRRPRKARQGGDDSRLERRAPDRDRRGQPGEAAPAPPRPPRSPWREGSPDPPVDLNHAPASDLVRLPGVGPVMAARIVEARERLGRFGALEDLRMVRGLRPAAVERLRPLVSLGGLPAGAGEAPPAGEAAGQAETVAASEESPTLTE